MMLPAANQGSLEQDPIDLHQADLDRLRALLLHEDRSSVVWRAEFTDLLTRHLLESLRRAEKEDPKGMARVLSPTVVHSIRREIANSKDELVDALYPITGRLVRASVGNAVKELVADINARLDVLSSPALFIARLRSFVSGKPVSTFLIAESVMQNTFSRAFLIDRHTGFLAYSWVRSDRELENNKTDANNLIGAMFSAISTFTSEVYSTNETELRTIDLNGHMLAIRQAARNMLVVEFVGKMTHAAEAHIDLCFEQIMAAPADPAILARIDILEVPHALPEKKHRSLRLLIALVLFALGAAISWSLYDRWWFNGTVQAVTRFVTSDPSQLSPQIVTDRSARTILLQGPVSAGFDPAQIASSLHERGVRLVNQTQPLASARDVDHQLAEIQKMAGTLSIVEDRMRAEMLAHEKRRQDEISRISLALETAQSQLEARTAEIVAEYSSVTGKAKSAIEAISLSFNQSNSFANSNEASQQLAVIGTLANLHGFQLRVEGYGDLVGAHEATEKIALLRADAVRKQLLMLGIVEDQIVAVSRAAVPDSTGRVARQVRIVVEGRRR